MYQYLKKPELAIEFSRVTQPGALARYNLVGRGDKKTADGAPVQPNG
ncbi:hypothetical protein ACVGWY_00245, partial [Enterobacter intestinihominis]